MKNHKNEREPGRHSLSVSYKFRITEKFFFNFIVINRIIQVYAQHYSFIMYDKYDNEHWKTKFRFSLFMNLYYLWILHMCKCTISIRNDSRIFPVSIKLHFMLLKHKFWINLLFAHENFSFFRPSKTFNSHSFMEYWSCLG